MVPSSSQTKPMLLIIVLLVISSFQKIPFLVKANEECNRVNGSRKPNCGEEFKEEKEQGTSPIFGIQLVEAHEQVVLDNGVLQVTLSNPGGDITGIRYNGIDNLIEYNETHGQHGGYWDINWDVPGKPGLTGKFDILRGRSYEIIEQSTDRVEISFVRKWKFSNHGHNAPLNIDKRFIMLSNSSGFYSYAIIEHSKDMPGLELYEARIAFMLKKDKFRYMAIADNIQRHMPLPDDRSSVRSKNLAYKEAVLLVDPIEPQFAGQVDDKYQYSCENKDCTVHGWICSDPPVGFWQISPSIEFKTGGPTKQDLTSHVGPATLSMFVSTHYGGKDVELKVAAGEPWKKVFGPVFIYLNSVSDGTESFSLWHDAKNQMEVEVQSWPYDFPNSVDFPKSDQRGSVIGRLLVQDQYLSEQLLPAISAYVGLAPPGERGSWQSEGKGYQFWTTADDLGNFRIDNIREGNYNIYAWVPGIVGDYHLNYTITITSGYYIKMGDLVYEPPRFGPMLWEIGIPDRTAAEFYIPDPDPTYLSSLYISYPERFRQYGLWDRYSELYPDRDLVYAVGYSDYRQDWFFAHVNRKIGNHSYKPTTWEIKFYIEYVNEGDHNLLVALASANDAKLQVRVNDPRADPPHFSTSRIGKDNAIARHGIHGLYRLYRVKIASTQLVEGQNSIYLTQASGSSPFSGLMYDYIRLDGPSPYGYLSYGPSSSF